MMSDKNKITLDEEALAEILFAELEGCDKATLAKVTGFVFGGTCYFIDDDQFEFFPNENYTGAFGALTTSIVDEVDNTIPLGITQKTSYSFRVPYYDDNGAFSHYVYPASSCSPTESGYLEISFDSPEEAYAFLDEQGLREEAVEEKWLLIKSEAAAVHYVQPKELK